MRVDVFECKTMDDFFDRLKSTPNFKSLRQLSKKLGYSSDRALGMAVKGDRVVSDRLRENLAEWANFSPKEYLYFSVLIEKSKAQLQKRAIHNFDRKLAALRPGSKDSRAISVRELRALSQWYDHVIIDLIDVLGEQATATNIRRSLLTKISAQEILESLDRQMQLGRLKRNSEGIYCRLETTDYIQDEQLPSRYLREMHKRFIELAKAAVEDQSMSDRHIVGVTIPLDRAAIAAAKKRVNEVMHELMNELSCTDATKDRLVYQMNFQLFQLADPKKHKD